MPKYSIVMPTLTRDSAHAEVMAECVESVKRHSRDYELIIVDDGSSIKTVEMSMADTLIVHNTSRGIAPSWNDGWKVSRGTYVVIINDDIVVKDGWVKAMEECFIQSGNCGVSAPAVQHLPNGNGIEVNGNWFPGSCFMIQNELKHYVGFFDEQFSPFNYEDCDMWTRILKKDLEMYRNYSVEVEHKEGDVLHKLEYGEVSKKNLQKFIDEWGFDPKPVFYGNKPIIDASDLPDV